MPDRRRSIVLLVVVLILTGTALPSTAIRSTADGQERPTVAAGSNPAPDVDTRNQSPVERKREAIRIVESMDVGWRFQARQRDRAIDRLNGTLPDYRDRYRLDSASVFRDDRRALGALATIAWINASAAEEAADHVVAADLSTVNTSIEDARLALQRTRGRIDEPRDRRRAERSIDRAVRARDRGLRTLDEDAWSPWRSTERRRAIVHLGIAWLHAQHALEVLDRSSEPALTIETRSDPARNGSGPITRTIRGNVSDVRAYELGNVSVSVNGTQVGSAPVEAVPAPGQNASFAVNVTLDRPVAEVSVAVTDVDDARPAWLEERQRGWRDRFDHRGDRGDEDDAWHDRFGRSRPDSDSADDRFVADIVRFDGDGLPDRYEMDVVGTDPLDPDSDSGVTDADESDDGVLDGGEDFDGDGLITYAEYELGTDPFENDTDGDGLPDRFEASFPGLLDPTDADTDGDDVVDGAEDFDDDGLSASAEYTNDTSIARADSDGDGLDDGEEVLAHGTSPLDVDTDGDGLEDAEELRLGVDPLLADTDGDGLPDGNETYTTTAVDEETGVRMSLSGSGDVASHVDVENVSQPSRSDYLAAPVVRVQNHTEFQNATVTLPLEEVASSSDGRNLSVYKWSPGDDRPWHSIDSTVDVANGTASADVSSFSFFTVMDEREWEAAITDTISLDWPRHEAFSDLSGWDVEGDAGVDDGRLVVSGSGSVEVDPDVVVAQDGSGDFERIQAAVDAVEDGQTILVEEGTYGEEVVLDASVQLVGRDATIDSRGTANDVGIRVVGNASPSISGFTITNFDTGIVGRSRSSEVRLFDVALRENRVGLYLRGSGRWVLDEVSAVGNVRRGIGIFEHDGDVHLSAAELSGNRDVGLFFYSYTGSATVSDSVISNNGDDGVVFFPSACDCTFRDVDVSDNGGHGIVLRNEGGDTRLDGVEMRGNTAGLYVKGENDVVLSDVEMVENQYGVYTGGTPGHFELSDVDIVGTSRGLGSGVKARGSAADWALSDVTIRDNGYTAIFGQESTGSWDLEDVTLSENGVNIHAPGASGTWSLAGVRSDGARTDGIDASGTTGRWSLTDVALRNNGRNGLTLAESTATWRVADSELSSNGRYGIDASGAGGTVDVSRSAIEGNDQAGVVASDATPPIDATDNWWGQETGPTSAQTNGSVVTDPYCRTSTCSPDAQPSVAGSSAIDRPRGTPHHDGSHLDALDRAGGSSVHRELALPGDAERIVTSARVKGQAGRDSAARVLITGPSETVVVADARSTSGRFRTESADLSRFAGETVTFEVVADGDAKITVDWIDVAYDTDGDGLRDAVERAELGMPSGPRPGAPITGLDPTKPDSDGDGLLDGEELTEVAVEHDSVGIGSSISFRAEAAAADPTVENSDGGGLNDSEEMAAGSDPFVLETLVIGYALPTMTDGPGDTLEDREPMTVGEANGLQAGAGRDSDVIAWPSRQYLDPLFCIKELTAGPGCSEAWMQGVEIRDEHFYVYVPFVVYAQSNLDFGEVPYELTLASHPDAAVVKEVNTTSTIGGGQSQRGYIVFEFPERRTDFEIQRRLFRPLGEFTLDADLSNTVFERPKPSSVGRRYTVSTSTTLPRTEQMLQDTQFVLEQGINVAFAVEAGYTVAIETGSSLRGALAFLYHLAKSQTSTPPTSVEDVAEKVSHKGIAAFEEKVRETQGEIDEDIFGDGVVRSVGPTIIRQN